MGSQQIDIDTSTPILNFYKDKTVFITGATGFLGTVLLEKLLFSTQLKKVYILVKPRKGCSSQERLNNTFEKECFRRVKEIRPNVLKKVVAVTGDIVEENLGMTEQDRKLLQQEVNIVIHAAASVNFNLPLAEVMEVNTRAAIIMLQFATTIKQLQAFVYLSTAYSNVHENNDIVEEKIFDLPISEESAFYAVESKSVLVQHIADRWPNKYAFTKALTEKIIATRFSHLPIAIVRPSIIICAVKEPMPGWVEGWNSANPVVMWGGRHLRVWHCEGSSVVDVVPVDYTANCVLAAAWDCYNRRVNGETDVKVFNYCSGLRNPITMQELLSLTVSNNKIHYKKNMMPWFCVPIYHPTWLAVLIFFLQTVPAYFVEVIYFLMGKKSRQMRLHKTIIKMYATQRYFCLNQFILIDRNVKELFDSMDVQDKALFPFDVKDISWKKLFYNYTFGLKTYVLKMK